jgi:hypothetical protein
MPVLIDVAEKNLYGGRKHGGGNLHLHLATTVPDDGLHQLAVTRLDGCRALDERRLQVVGFDSCALWSLKPHARHLHHYWYLVAGLLRAGCAVDRVACHVRAQSIWKRGKSGKEGEQNGCYRLLVCNLLCCEFNFSQILNAGGMFAWKAQNLVGEKAECTSSSEI